MTSTAFINHTKQRQSALDVIGTKVSMLSSETDMPDLKITLQSGDDGMGPPPHSHDWEETFYVTKGLIYFTCGDKVASCEAGTLVHVPGGVVHSFSYGPEGGEMLEITGKGSNAIRMFTALNDNIPPGPPDIPKVIDVLKNHGVTPVI